MVYIVYYTSYRSQTKKKYNIKNNVFKKVLRQSTRKVRKTSSVPRSALFTFHAQFFPKISARCRAHLLLKKVRSCPARNFLKFFGCSYLQIVVYKIGQIRSKNDADSVKNGYYEDDALQKLFAREADSVDRKSPEIARGTWARVQGTRQELRWFYEKNASRKKVVINCGAGFDTTHWWSKSEELWKSGDLWFDLDMEPVVRQRIRRLRMPGAKSLLSPLKNLKITDNQLSSDNYFIRKLDMKQSDGSVKLLEDIKEEFEIDEQTDVCLVFECVLVYMATEISGRFLKAAADLFQNLKVISYEQV